MYIQTYNLFFNTFFRTKNNITLFSCGHTKNEVNIIRKVTRIEFLKHKLSSEQNALYDNKIKIIKNYNEYAKKIK